VSFTKTQVKVATGGNSYAYTLKDITSVPSENYIQLLFNELEPTEAITVKEKIVSMVNFNVIGQNFRGGLIQWYLDDGTPHYPDVEQYKMKFSYTNNNDYFKRMAKFYKYYNIDISGYVLIDYTGTATNVTIPNNINGVPVTIIGEAFYNNPLTSIYYRGKCKGAYIFTLEYSEELNEEVLRWKKQP